MTWICYETAAAIGALWVMDNIGKLVAIGLAAMYLGGCETNAAAVESKLVYKRIDAEFFERVPVALEIEVPSDAPFKDERRRDAMGTLTIVANPSVHLASEAAQDLPPDFAAAKKLIEGSRDAFQQF